MVRPMFVELVVLSCEIPVKAGRRDKKAVQHAFCNTDEQRLDLILVYCRVLKIKIMSVQRDNKLNFSLIF